MNKPRLVAATAALALAGSVSGALASSSVAASAPTVTPIAKHLVGPLSVAQAPDGTRYWTDDFASQLWKQSPGGAPTMIFQGTKKGGVESVSADYGKLRFTTGASDNSAGNLWTLDATGKPQLVADIGAYEKAANPDHSQKYGWLKTPKRCTDLLAPTSPPKAYKGVVETHPYATATAADGTTYVADAGANAIFRVSPTGVVSTVAVIKPATVKVTKRIQAAADLPDCLLGKKVALESVPTDVEIGPGGQLYVSNLSGGPEDGRFGANGRISKVDPVTGAVTTLSKGYASATGLAVSPTGDVYVADLFMNVIGVLPAGHKNMKTFVEAKLPAAVEWTPTGLLATVKALPGKKPKGQVVTITR